MRDVVGVFTFFVGFTFSVDFFEVFTEWFEIRNDKLFGEGSVDDFDVVFDDVVEDFSADFYRSVFVVGVELLVLVN